MHQMLLSLNNISKGFGNPGDLTFRPVLTELSLSVDRGERIAILGPSGSGKTTLLNIIGGLDHPDRGEVIFDGTHITRFSTVETDRYRNESIGFVFQFHHLLPQCTLLENILVPTLVQGKEKRREKVDRAGELMKRVGIWDYKDQLPGKLSGGECQRAAVVRAMINRPSLLLADEPTGALDRENVDIMAELLLDLNKEDGLTLLVVTHSAGLAERMGRTLELQGGKLEER
jgi:ABC-type lipoprotein export system ATPase subunit